VLSSQFPGVARLIALGLACAAMLACAAPAAAGGVYVTNSADDSVSVVDGAGGGSIATVSVGDEPVDVAISPDGSRAYVANRADGTVSVIDTAQNQVVGAPIPVGSEPRGLALSPDGTRLYVTNSGDGTVSVISTASGAPIVDPIPVGEEPDGVAVAPDGGSAFVAQRGGGISAIDTGSNAVVGTIPDALGPSRISIGPHGGRAFVTNSSASSVSAFNPINLNLVGAPVATGMEPAGIAVDPSGANAYAASPADGTLTAIDTSLDSVLGVPLGGFPGATGVAFEPRGLSAYVTDASGTALTRFDATRNVTAGSIPVGTAPTAAAVVPNQGPRANLFISPVRARAKKRLTFHAAGSSDPDGSIVNYAWDFGDGGHAEGSSPTRTHRYRRPGNYQVTLVVTDDEGCSTELVFTGQTAYCNGSAAAGLSTTLTVLNATGPKLRLRGARRQRLRGRVKVFAHCVGRPCAFRASGILVTSVERFGLVRRSRHRMARAASVAFSRGWRRLSLRLPGRTRRAAARALRRGGLAKVRISVIATDETGDQSLAARKVKLVR
jgi:YVTN family beta-propeller protein